MNAKVTVIGEEDPKDRGHPSTTLGLRQSESGEGGGGCSLSLFMKGGRDYGLRCLRDAGKQSNREPERDMSRSLPPRTHPRTLLRRCVASHRNLMSIDPRVSPDCVASRRVSLPGPTH